jgi:photosystem II stability/assembly factor-like uncharacterized protein
MRISTLACVFAALFLSTTVNAQQKNKSAKKHTHKKEKKEKEREKESEGEALEERERAEWEWKRTADPATGKVPENIRDKEIAYSNTLPKDDNSRSTNPVNWESRGPWNYGGRTRSFAIDLNNENIMLAGSVGGGVWRSTTGGQSWNKVTANNQNPAVTCLAQDPRPAYRNTWYYGTGEAYGASLSGGGSFFLGSGLFKSTDNGVTWLRKYPTTAESPQTFASVNQLIWNVAVDPTDTLAGEIYIASYGAIMRSTNGGTNFAVVRGSSSSSPFSYFSDVAVTSTGVVYATLSSDGLQKGIWRSATGLGNAWTNILPPNFPTTYDRIVIGINPSNENEVYFLGRTPGFGKTTYNFQGDPEQNSLWRYTYVSGTGAGAGGIWEDLSANLPFDNTMFGKFNCQGGYDLLVKVKPDEPNVVFIGGTNLYRSTSAFNDSLNTTMIGGYGINTGLPWFTIYPNHHPDQHSVSFLPSNPDVMISTNDGGIFKTTNCLAPSVTYTPLNNGYLSTQFYTVAIDHGTPGDSVIIGGAQDNGTLFTGSMNPQFTWTQPSSGDGSYCAITDGGGAYYYSRQEGKVMKSTMDGTGHVDKLVRIDPTGGKDYVFISPFVLDPNNENIMYLAAGHKLWRNNDLSAFPLDSSWTTKLTNWDSLETTLDTNALITALAVCKTPANRIYYGTDARNLYRLDNANVGQPVPVNLTNSTLPAGTTSFVSCIAVDPNDGDKLLAVYSNYNIYSLFYSTDAGTTWTKVAGNLEQVSTGTGNGPSIRWASILPVGNSNVYFVGTSTGLYATDTLNGLSTIWTLQGASTIGNVVVDMIDTRVSDGLVVVATHGRGFFTGTVTDQGQVTSAKDLFKKTDLVVYPNPAKGPVTVAFDIATAGQYSIEILDELGKIVKVINTSDYAAGPNKVQLDVNGLRSGIYYCHLKGAIDRTVQFVVTR